MPHINGGQGKEEMKGRDTEVREGGDVELGQQRHSEGWSKQNMMKVK